MASVNFSGVLLEPLGDGAQFNKIRFTHNTTTGSTVKGTCSVHEFGTDGSYNFNVQYGNVHVETYDDIKKRWSSHGVITINSETTATSIPALIGSIVPVTDETILEVQTLLADTESARDDAEAARDDAEAAYASFSSEKTDLETNVALALASNIKAVTGGRNLAIVDAFGNAQLVCRIPLCTYEDLNVPGCPFTGAVDAFRRSDGTLRPYVDICIHEAANVGGKAVSQAGLDPWNYINTDTSRARCEELGTGWHMMGAYERALLGWIMLSKNFQPRGNTEYGRAYNAINEFGRRQDGLVPNDRAGAARVLTGSGPDEWRHDGTPFGVSNLVGNVWERDEGWKMIDGQFYVAEYLGQDEADWVATGRYINSGHVLSMTPPPSPVASNQVWGSLTKSGDYVGHDLMQRLLIEPIACTAALGGRFYYNTDGERFPFRGGFWGNASDAGPAALNCGERSVAAGSSIGFRSAYAS